MSGRKAYDAKLLQLEKRVDIAMKGLNIFLLKDSEEISRKEKKILEQRMKDFASKRNSSFVELKKYLQSHSSQESD